MGRGKCKTENKNASFAAAGSGRQYSQMCERKGIEFQPHYPKPFPPKINPRGKGPFIHRILSLRFQLTLRGNLALKPKLRK